MPLVTWTVLAYAAALIVALSVGDALRVALAAVALAGTVGLTLLARRIPAIVSAIVASALLVGMSARVLQSRCVARLATVREWQADLETDARRGSATRLVLRRDGCTAPATVLVAHGEGRAGDRAVVRGRPSADAKGIFVQDAAIGASSSRSPWTLRARASAGKRIDHIFGADAPMARALIIADMSAISAEQRDRYSRAGLVHMLSVSGLHVGIIALALELLAAVCRLPRVPARAATMLLLAVYVTAIGAPAPAVRAAVMLGALLLSKVIQRPTSPWAILALGAVSPLWNPTVAIDLGWQLSVAGTAALIAGASLARRCVPATWRSSWRSLATGALVSIVATAVTAPLVAWTFGRVSLLGPVTNLLADPVMALLQPLLFLAMAIPVHAVEVFTADAAHALLVAFDAIARGAVTVPGASPVVMPTMVGAVAAAGASVCLVVACIARRPSRTCVGGSLCVAVMVAGPLIPHTASAPELHMLDVGQGDALALRTSRGRWIVVDAGRSWTGGDAGRSIVAPYLARRGGEIALFVLSHPHADHVGGAASLFALLHPKRLLDPGYVGTSAPYRSALAQARAERIPWQRVWPGDTLIVDDVVLSALAPDSAWAATLNDANLASTVLLARVGRWGTRILFTGDAESPEEDWLLEHSPDALRADVLKVAHHGSITSTTPRFLDAVHPRLALVSVGAHNAYGHPDPEVVDRLRAAGIVTLRSDHLGTTVLRFLEQGIDVTTRDAHWLIPR